DPLTFLEMWMTDGSANRMDYSDEKYDDLIDKIREETDESKRFDMMLEAEKKLMDEMHILPMVQDADAILMKQNIDGFVRHPADAVYDYKRTKVKEYSILLMNLNSTHHARFIIKGFLIKKRVISMKQKLLWPVLCIGLLF